MASNYTPTKETANFGKFARIILDLCRDAVFQILAKEIAPAALPSKIRANLHCIRLSTKQLNKIFSKPPGVPPGETDFDISALYTLVRNICPGIPSPSQGWDNSPGPSDILVSDDIERIREKRNVLYGHAYSAALSDTEFNNEMAEMSQIIARLDSYLGQNFMSGLCAIQGSTMDPDMEKRFTERCQQLLKQDQETREQLDAMKDQQMGAQIRQEETIEMLYGLQDTLTAEQLRQQEVIGNLRESQDRQMAEQLRQEEAMEVVQDQQVLDKEETMVKLKILQDQQIQDKEDTMVNVENLREQQQKLTGRVTDIQREMEALSQKDDQTRGDRRQVDDTGKLQSHLHKQYQGEKSPKVSIIPAYDDVPLSSIFTPVVIREDLETAFSLQAKEPGQNKPSHSVPRTSTGEAIKLYKEMFFKDGELQNNIYLLGKAGSGKTTFCNHLIDLWCPSSTTAHYDDPEMIREFEFIFFVTCRDAEESQKVIDMVLEQLFSTEIEYHSLVKHVLQTKPEKCLVIIDGLDEWTGSPTRSAGPRTPLGLPDRRGLENCVCLTTSRPWRIEALRQGVGKSYRIIEIKGLTEENVHSLADKAVEALNENKLNEEVSLTDFLSAVETAKLTEVVTNPLMLLILLASWHGRRSLDISQCVNYAGLIESLLQHAEGRSGRSDASNRLSDLPQLPGLKADWARSNTTLPECFSSLHFCKLYAQLISKVSELAFNGLFHEIKEKSLVFSELELGKYLRTSEVDVCCRIGILSLSRARSMSLERIKTVSFLHKTLQEFLAAVWMTGDSYGNCLSVFKKHCKCVADVLDLSVFQVFLCGLSPEKGREVWRYIGELTPSDPAVQENRADILDVTGTVFESQPVPCLQQLLLQCTAEAIHQNPDVPLNCIIQDYNIQDVYVDSGISVENLDLLLGHAVDSDTGIKSLEIDDIKPSPEILEVINRMVSLECLSILSPPEHSDPKQLCEVIFTAVNSLSPVTSLKLSEISIAAPNRLFTVQLPRVLKFLALFKVSTTGRMQVSWPVTMETLHMYEVTLDHGSVLQLATWLQGSSSLQQLCITRLKCIDCGHSCQYPIHIARCTMLHRLNLFELSVDRLRMTASNLQTLYLHHVHLQHDDVMQLATSIQRSSCLREMKIEDLQCRDCIGSCHYQFDVTKHTRLCNLVLYHLDVDKVQINPSNLESLHIGWLYQPGVAVPVLSYLHRAPQLTELTLGGCKLTHEISTLCSVLPRLPQLLTLALSDICCGDLGVWMSPNMTQLRVIRLWKVTMSARAWSRFARSLPLTSHQLTVELWNVTMSEQAWSYFACSLPPTLQQLTMKLLDVKIDAATRRYIAAHFTVTWDIPVDLPRRRSGRRQLVFHSRHQT